MKRKRSQSNVKTGEFPYPLTDGPDEARYLTWVRNHSNYMAERGFLDYLRLVAVLMRGILVNFLTLLPYLLFVALMLGVVYNTLLDDWNAQVVKAGGEGSSIDLFVTREATTPGWAMSLQDRVYEGKKPTPFLVTPMVLALAVAWVLLFPVVSRLSRIVGYKKTLETGTSSSVKKRDLFERSFGGLLLTILAVALIESLPLLVHSFHQLRVGELGWQTFPTVAGAAGVLAAANKLLPLLGGWMKKLAIVFVGALGLLVPLVVVLFVTEFLVYADAYEGPLIFALFLLPLLIALGIIVAMILGIRSFKGRGFGRLFLLLAGMIGLFIAVLVLFIMVEAGQQNFVFVLAWTVEIWVFCWLTVDVNLTSINGLYRDRLASAFLVGEDTRGDVDIEQDIDLQEICHYAAGSTAPYHLVNVALNLQGSKDITVRERNSDFFIFSKRFIGSDRTGYCRSENMEQVYPQIDLGTAMAISAAAASPNMGRGTNPLMVAFLTLLNIRLGFWLPNPGRLEERLVGTRKRFATDVFPEELVEIQRRREQAYRSKAPRPLDRKKEPTTAHNLVGIGFSGGGIRSATINLGIAQALHRRGVFDHIDYMSTVSGGGYLGSSISTLMRYEMKPVSEVPGTVSVETGHAQEKIVRVTGTANDVREYRFSNHAELDDKIRNGTRVKAGQRLLRRSAGSGLPHNSLMDRFQWRVRPGALLREMMSMLDETHKWVNLSDGGHIENLAAIELLRRKCRFVIIGDGEADPDLHFNGLATLIRYARIDLGIHIDIVLDSLRLAGSEDENDRRSRSHFAVGRITYPGEEQCGHLLYLKSSFTGDEDEVIVEYRHRNPDFPHESTADQFFDEGQFEAYRALGQHIGEQALLHAPSDGKLSFSGLEEWFTALAEADRQGAPSSE
jgi:hypothetical protein